MIPIPGIHDGYEPAENHALPVASRKRLSAQCAKMLELLQQGPVTNDALSRISRKYTSRVSDMRAAGIDIRCYDLDHKTGLSWYRIA